MSSKTPDDKNDTTSSNPFPRSSQFLFKPSVLLLPSTINFSSSEAQNNTSKVDLTKADPKPLHQTQSNNVPSSLNTTASIFNPPKPVAASNNTTKSDSYVAPPGFTFGSNIADRVMNTTSSFSSKSADVPDGKNQSALFKTPADSSPSLTAVSDFKSFVTQASWQKEQNYSTTNHEITSNDSLKASADKLLAKQRNASLSLSKVEVFTGEEDEIPVARQHCRCYIFDSKENKWNALGSADLHLNDLIPSADDDNNCEDRRSRLVMRLSATRKVIANTLVWPDMPIERVNARSFRIGTITTQSDNIERPVLKSFLLTVPDEVDTPLFQQLLLRRDRMKSRAMKKNQEAFNTIPDSRKRRSDFDDVDTTAANHQPVKIFARDQQLRRSSLPPIGQSVANLARSSADLIESADLMTPPNLDDDEGWLLGVGDAKQDIDCLSMHQLMLLTPGPHYYWCNLEAVSLRLIPSSSSPSTGDKWYLLTVHQSTTTSHNHHSKEPPLIVAGLISRRFSSLRRLLDTDTNGDDDDSPSSSYLIETMLNVDQHLEYLKESDQLVSPQSCSELKFKQLAFVVSFASKESESKFLDTFPTKPLLLNDRREQPTGEEDLV